MVTHWPQAQISIPLTINKSNYKSAQPQICWCFHLIQRLRDWCNFTISVTCDMRLLWRWLSPGKKGNGRKVWWEGLSQLKLARAAGNPLKFIKFSFAGITIFRVYGHRVTTSLKCPSSISNWTVWVTFAGQRGILECTLIWILMGNKFERCLVVQIAHTPWVTSCRGILQEALKTYAEINLRDK